MVNIEGSDTVSSANQEASRHFLHRLAPQKLGALALVVTGTLAFGVASHEGLLTGSAFAQSPTSTLEIPGPPSEIGSEPDSPGLLGDQANALVESTATAWAQHQTPDGRFLDPVSGQSGGYGTSMLGQAMVETGVATGNANLMHDGIQAELSAGEIKQLDSRGFELFGDGGFALVSQAGSYAWNEKNLSNNLDWQNARSTIAGYLTGNSKVAVNKSSSAQRCYVNPTCYDNLKLVTAYGEIEVMAAGFTDSSSSSSTGHIAALNAEVHNFLMQAVHNTNAKAHSLGSTMEIKDAGILTDPPTGNPLAYDMLSAMMLGHSIEALGGPARAPEGVEAAFQRTAQAIVGLMAPDGDVAYIGRGQGQVWNVAAAVDALSIAARNTIDPVWRGRYLAGATRGLNRLKTEFPPGDWGMPLVPRLAGDSNPNYSGVDPYANSTVYNGLAVWALGDAAVQLQMTQPAPAESIGADSPGVFINPSQFATVRKGNLWWAIHIGDEAKDARHDFGLIAAQKLINGTWVPAIPYRPLTGSKTSGGPVLVSHGVRLVPIGRKITADAAGVVDIQGGWAATPGSKPKVDTNTEWIFKPAGNDGVNLSFRANGRGNRTYQFQTWYEQGSDVVVTDKGIEVREPNGRQESYTLNGPVTVTPGPIYHSAYDKNLGSSILTVHAKAGDKVNYTTRF
jgi:hypothetical protein